MEKEATKMQPWPVSATDDYFKFTNDTWVKSTWKNTEQQNSKEMLQLLIIMKPSKYKSNLKHFCSTSPQKIEISKNWAEF